MCIIGPEQEPFSQSLCALALSVFDSLLMIQVLYHNLIYKHSSVLQDVENQLFNEPLRHDGCNFTSTLAIVSLMATQERNKALRHQ